MLGLIGLWCSCFCWSYVRTEPDLAQVGSCPWLPLAVLLVLWLTGNTALVWIITIFVNIGMWFERFVIAVTTLTRDFLPSSWGYYSPTIVDIFTYLGTFGLFSVLFLLFLRFLPLMAMAEIKAVTPQADPHQH